MRHQITIFLKTKPKTLMPFSDDESSVKAENPQSTIVRFIFFKDGEYPDWLVPFLSHFIYYLTGKLEFQRVLSWKVQLFSVKFR